MTKFSLFLKQKMVCDFAKFNIFQLFKIYNYTWKNCDFFYTTLYKSQEFCEIRVFITKILVLFYD